VTDPHELIDLYLDGELTAAQAEELRAWIDASPDNADAFAESVCLEDGLDRNMAAPYAEPSTRPPVAKLAPADDEPITFRRAHGGLGRSILYRYAAAAVLLIATGLVVSMWRPSSPDADPSHEVAAFGPVATLTDATDARWDASSVFLSPGSDLDAGALRLRSGRAQIVFRSGAAVDLFGAVDFQLTGPNSGRLESGRVRVSVPASAIGFRIDTPTHAVIDLGTRFGVRVADDAHSEVHVFEGKVRVEPHEIADASSSVTLRTGEAVALTGDHREGRSIPLEMGRFDATPTLANTGAGVAANSHDPRWWVRGKTFELAPRPAVAVAVKSDPNQSDRSMAISFASPPVDEGDKSYTYSTFVDVDRADARQAAIRGRLAADNNVVEIRINGEIVNIEDLNQAGYSFRPFDIPAGYLDAGQNVIEIDVRNARGRGSRQPTWLRVEWSLEFPNAD